LHVKIAVVKARQNSELFLFFNDLTYITALSGFISCIHRASTHMQNCPYLELDAKMCSISLEQIRKNKGRAKRSIPQGSIHSEYMIALFKHK
jgi:hypothetical protein